MVKIKMEDSLEVLIWYYFQVSSVRNKSTDIQQLSTEETSGELLGSYENNENIKHQVLEMTARESMSQS